jgi:membrane protein DedA with SNARE-associated domain
MIIAFIESLIAKLVDITLSYGVLGLGLGMFLESVGIPATSVVLELTAGTLIATGRTTFFVAVIVSTAGLVLGSIVSYAMGYYGLHFIGRFSPRVLDAARKSRARDLLVRHGEISILFAQLFGTARTWISLPAGAMGIGFLRFVSYTAIGGAIYCAGAIGISLALTTVLRKYYRIILSYLHLPTIIGIIISIILFIVWLKYRKNRKNKEAEQLEA